MSHLTKQITCDLYIDGDGGSWFKRVNLPCVPHVGTSFFFDAPGDQFTVSSWFFSENDSGEFDVVVLFNEAISGETIDEQMVDSGWEWEWDPEREEATDGTHP